MKAGLWVLAFLVFATIGFPTSSLGPAIKISTHPDNVNGLDFFPQIAADASGNSYVVWQGHDGFGFKIYWVKIDPSGIPHPVQKITAQADGVMENYYSPQIAVDAAGNSYITWQDYYCIYWVKIEPSGAFSQFQKIFTYPDGDWSVSDPQIAIDSSGNSYIVWESNNGSEYDIYWVRIDAEGIPGTVCRISPLPDDLPDVNIDPQIAADDTGNSYVTWQCRSGDRNDIYWVKIDASGVPGAAEKI